MFLTIQNENENKNLEENTHTHTHTHTRTHTHTYILFSFTVMFNPLFNPVILIKNYFLRYYYEFLIKANLSEIK